MILFESLKKILLCLLFVFLPGFVFAQPGSTYHDVVFNDNGNTQSVSVTHCEGEFNVVKVIIDGVNSTCFNESVEFPKTFTCYTENDGSVINNIEQESLITDIDISKLAIKPKTEVTITQKIDLPLTIRVTWPGGPIGAGAGEDVIVAVLDTGGFHNTPTPTLSIESVGQTIDHDYGDETTRQQVDIFLKYKPDPPKLTTVEYAVAERLIHVSVECIIPFHLFSD